MCSEMKWFVMGKKCLNMVGPTYESLMHISKPKLSHTMTYPRSFPLAKFTSKRMKAVSGLDRSDFSANNFKPCLEISSSSCFPVLGCISIEAFANMTSSQSHETRFHLSISSLSPPHCHPTINHVKRQQHCLYIAAGRCSGIRLPPS